MNLLANLFDPARSRGAMRAITRPLYSWSLSGAAPDRLVTLPPDPWQGDAGCGRWVMNRVLDVHGLHVTMAQNGWSRLPQGVPLRAAHALHAFEWLRDLRALGGDAARRHGRILMQEWMEANRNWHEGIWGFDVTARRVAAWLTGYDFFCASADDGFLDLFYTSLAKQVRHLDRAEPDSLSGIDALCVIRAQVFAGLGFEDGGPRLDHALGWLDHWLAHELDGDGMVSSRSPDHAVHIARMLIDIRGALVRGGIAASAPLHNGIDRIMHAIRFFRMPDQKLACFHGTQEGDATALDSLFRVSAVRIRKPPTQLKSAGFESLTRERVTVIADCGGPARHPHDVCNHASPLAFEMCVGRDRLVVNCGTHPLDSVWADHLRATAAHSGLTVDDRNSCEICADGHIGRAPAHVAARRDLTAGGITLTMSHDGYAPLNGLVHTRRLALLPDGHALEGEDWLASDAPLMKPAPFAIRFHLHPRVQASLIQDGNAALLRLPSGGGWRFARKAGTLSLEPSIYCGTGVSPRKTQQLVITGATDGGNCCIGWSFTEEI